MRFLPYAVAAAALALSAVPAAADITRGCGASVDVAVISPGPLSVENLGEIEGRGSCKNKANANDCRERARAALLKCRNDMWANRHANSIPSSCNSLVSGSGRSGAKLTYAGIAPISEPNRLMARAALSACCRLRPNKDKLSIQIAGRINGDKKCAAHKIGNDRYQEEYGFPRYEMSCKAWREKGICG